MIPITVFAGQKVALFGLGGSGLATALALKAGGAQVEACDDNLQKMVQAQEKGIVTTDLKSADWSTYSALILSPGVPLTHPVPHWSVEAALKAGVEVIGDIELFCRERAQVAPHALCIAITGTNGKSTTTALIAHMLSGAGFDVQMGGNIGTALLSLEPFSEKRAYVIECSSFQIDLAPSLRPDIGVLLNLSPDHLDRHGTMEKYAAIKERFLQAATHAVVGDDDSFTQAVAGRLHGGITHISSAHPLQKGLFARDATIILAEDGEETKITDLSGSVSLRGAHNAQNACAAVAVARALHIPQDVIVEGLKTFPGLAHRMEQVGQVGKILFINDSKATNADSAEKALMSFDHIYWIAGGLPKAGGIETLQPLFPKVVKAYLIGTATEEFSKTLEGRVPYCVCGTLDEAVKQAAKDALQVGDPAGVVLLSPACASYDQYPNFEVRGEHFRSLVKEIVKE